MKMLMAHIQEVLITDEGLIITGSPIDSNDEQHNCDCAGCSSLTHVVYRNGEPQVSVMDLDGVDGSYAEEPDADNND